MKRIRLIFIVLFFLTGSLLASEESAVSEYAFAQKCYHSLDKTSSQGWSRCIDKFQKVRAKYPESLYSKKALFSIGRLSQEMYELSGNSQDLERAFKIYNQFLKSYPKETLADDCLYRIAKLRFEKEKDREKAERALEVLLQRYPEGDMAEPAKTFLTNLKENKNSVMEIHGNIRTVVIDPGHGGEDTGARGKLGTLESVVALQIARKVAVEIKKKMGVDVTLTRTNNKQVSLAERTALANHKKADLFISIHANAHASQKVKGIQTFYLNNATSEAAQELANRENKVAGKKLSLPERILTTMLQNANTLESRDLAHSVQQTLVSRLNRSYSEIKDLEVDTAIFQVLDGVRCPSILIETSFITNLTEEKRLKDSRYQWAIAEGIAQGVTKYIQAQKTVASGAL